MVMMAMGLACARCVGAQALPPRSQSVIIMSPRGVSRGGGWKLPQTFESANGKFQLIMEPDTSSVDLRAVMIKAANATPLWVTKFPQVRPVTREWQALVSDEGDFFVMMASRNGNASLFREGFQKALVIGSNGLDWTESMFLSLGDLMAAIDRGEGVSTLRLWDAEAGAWAAFRTTDASAVPVMQVRPEVIARWNEAARKEVLDTLYAARLAELRRKASEISAPLAKLAGGPGTASAMMPTESQFGLLARLHNPEDRKIIGDLVEKGETPLHRFGRIRYGTPDPYDFDQTDVVRAEGDWLLALWDRKVTNRLRSGRFENVSDRPRFFLGKVYGTVRLPMPMPIYGSLTQATQLHVRLIRAEDAERTSGKVREERLSGTIGFDRARNRKVVCDANFGFTTVPPGTYRLKVIWDKRAPHSDTNSAGPGDYESAISTPVTVTAGGVISNIILYCTNRIAGGESY
jgi:hypothetical protein